MSAGPTVTFPLPRTDPFDPPPGYTALRHAEPLTLATMTVGKRQDVWLVTRYRECREILADARFSSDSRHPGYPLIRAFTRMIRDDPPEHTRFRQMLTDEFVGKRVAALQDDIRELTHELLDGVATRTPPVDLVPTLAMPLPSLVICRLLGVPYDQHDYLQERTAAALSKESSARQIDQAIDDLGDYLEQVVQAKLAAPGDDDLLSRFVMRHVRTGNCSYDDAVDIARLLLVAGHVTTVNMIGLGVLTLLQHPDQLTKLRHSPELIGGAVDELLRYLSITGGVARVATEDVEIAGRLIKAGQGVLVLHSVANRDPAEFPDPDRFDIHRDAHRHLAFGHGPHLCLGMLLARTEMRIVLGALLHRFPHLRLAVPVKDIPFRHEMRIYGIHGLPVCW